MKVSLNKHSFILLCGLFLIGKLSFSQKVLPISYYTFDESSILASSIGNRSLDTADYKCSPQINLGQIGKYADLLEKSCILQTNSFGKEKLAAFTLEFIFKGKQFQFVSFPKNFLIVNLDYPKLKFTTSHKNGSNISKDEFIIYLDKGEESSYNYWSDGDWHHLVFTCNSVTGQKEFWIDGVTTNLFQKKCEGFESLVFDEFDGFLNTSSIDEVALYSISLTPEQIIQHFESFKAGQHYDFEGIKKGDTRFENKRKKAFHEIVAQNDTLEFAPGYPNYTIGALDQLKSFPLPRYKAGVPMNRNFPWVDITYLSRLHKNNGKSSSWIIDVNNGIGLTDELCRYWNYFIEIPCLRTDSVLSNKRYSDTATLEGALIRYANQHPEFPSASVLMQVQSNPSHIGKKENIPNINSQSLPDSYYLRDLSGKPIVYNGKKWLSPLMPLDIIQIDGSIGRFYLSQLHKYLNSPVLMLNENGESFGHSRPDQLLNIDPAVKKHYSASGLSNSQYNSKFQYRLDSTYKAEIFKLKFLSNTELSFFNVSAIQPDYWPDYYQRRKLNQRKNGINYSTPDFYPFVPSNWAYAAGSYNGFGMISKARKVEIGFGDKLFSPFVAAGWELEENNFRPAQWLALLKSMIMLGADFFYTGYFNVTGPKGEWPNGKGPNDPRGYIYQLAIPSYAQALSSYLVSFISDGQLLNPASSTDLERQFRFKGNNDNELILVRKYKRSYLIYGSIQAFSNNKGSIPSEVTTQINLESKKIKFKIRRQGSMYVYDPSSASPVFYQIDGWHQYEHPYYWKREIVLEAELADKYAINGLVTEIKSKQNDDFSEFISGVKLTKGSKEKQEISWNFIPRNSETTFCKLIVKSTTKNTNVGIKLNNSLQSTITVPYTRGWSIIRIPLAKSILTKINNLKIEVASGEVIIDKIILEGGL